MFQLSGFYYTGFDCQAGSLLRVWGFRFGSLWCREGSLIADKRNSPKSPITLHSGIELNTKTQ